MRTSGGGEEDLDCEVNTGAHPVLCPGWLGAGSQGRLWGAALWSVAGLSGSAAFEKMVSVRVVLLVVVAGRLPRFTCTNSCYLSPDNYFSIAFFPMCVAGLPPSCP